MKGKKLCLLTRAFLLGALLTGSMQASAAPCLTGITASATILANGFTYNTKNTRNNTSTINARNVASLQLAYTHGAIGQSERRGAPVVTSQTIYTLSGTDLVAIDRKTGCSYWTFTVDPLLDPVMGGNLPRNSPLLVPAANGRPAMLFVGDSFANVYALNPQTGALIWKRFTGTDQDNHMITGSFQYNNGKLYVPVSTKEVVKALVNPTCCHSHGLLRALHADTGLSTWVYHATPPAILNPLTTTYGPSGASIWSTPAIDPLRNSLYVGTGQNLSHPTTYNSDAVVSLDLDTGFPNWVFQTNANDAWNAACNAAPGQDVNCPQPEGKDLDVGTPPILVTLPNRLQALIVGGKNGVVYALNPSLGVAMWSTRVGAGANLGGVHWGMAADSTKVYVGVSDVIVNKAVRAGDSTADRTTLVENGRPGVYALDLTTGAIVWEKHPTHLFGTEVVPNIYSAALSVANDVVFAGSLDGNVIAFRTSNGEQLWSYNTDRSFTDVDGVSGTGGTIDSTGPIVAGTDLLVNSGYKTFGNVNKYMGGSGNGLFVFRLPGK